MLDTQDLVRKVTPVLSQSEWLAESDIISQCSEPPLPRNTPHTGLMAVRDMGAMTGNTGTIAR